MNPGERTFRKHGVKPASIRKRLGAGLRRVFGREFVPAAPSAAEAERRLRSLPGFLASLTPEQIEEAKAYRGPEILGRGGPKLEANDPAA